MLNYLEENLQFWFWHKVYCNGNESEFIENSIK
jgi:hypothetical protein